MSANAVVRRTTGLSALLPFLFLAATCLAGDAPETTEAPKIAAAPSPSPEAPKAPAAQPSPSPSPDAQKAKVYWKDGATHLELENAELSFSNRIQFRFTDIFPDSSVQLPGTDKAGNALGSFLIRRAKTKVGGWFWKPELEAEVQIGWAGSDSTGGSSTFSGLEDAYLNWDVSKRQVFELRGGVFKVPFGRQEMNSSENMQFVERSILSGEFTHSRDVGVQVWGQPFGRKLDYYLGMFNGNGRNKPTNDNSKYQVDARVAYQPWGDVRFSEGDFESKDHPLLEVAAEFEQNDRRGATNINDFKDSILGGDLVFKYRGFSLYTEYFDRQRTPETGASFHSNGYIVQAGYFLQRNVWEVAFRYAWWDPTDAVSGDDQSELGAAVSRYILKHDLKVQADFRRLEDKVRDQRTHELRVQTQFVF
jgi:phosphate-selective porin OprO and OprP